ncbi:MAG: hypothetical protein U0903_01955 [Planctomycetales bacterium]
MATTFEQAVKPLLRSHPSLPIRAAVFTRMEDVDRAIDRLLQLGFRADQLTVVTSEEVIKQHFAEFQHEQPEGTYAPLGAIAGSTIGAAVLGGMSLLTMSLAPGAGLAIAAGWSAGAGGVIGGFIGAMASRGLEKETSEFYSQSLSEGEILLAVECHEGDGDCESQLKIAEEVFENLHKEPVPLPKG